MTWTSHNLRYKFGDAAVWILGVGMSGLILYYAMSLYGVRTQHANLVLGLSMALFYMMQFRDLYADTDSDGPIRGDEVTPTVVRGVRVSSVVPGFAAASGAVDDYVRPVVRRLRPLLYLVLAALSLGTAAYIQLEFSRLLTEAPIAGNLPLDFVVGAIVVVLVTDVTARAFGKIMGGVVVVGLLFGFLGPYLPGVFFHSGLGLEQTIRISAIGLGGVYGFILEVGTTWVAVFLLLAGFAKSYDILDYLVELSQEVSKTTRTGIVHVAVFSSLAFGSITGSGAANTATTGNFTIPMMKEQGVDKAYAGAIETVASIGGQLVPPIMGVAAFIMADILGVPYFRIVQAGIVPAFLFYFSVVVAVQLLLFKHGWTSEKSGAIDRRLFLDLLWYVVPFAVLLYMLAILRYSPLIAGYYTVLTLIGVVFVKTVIERGAGGVKTASVKTVEGLKQGAVDMAALMAVLGSIGVLIEVLTQTGFAQRLSTLMVGLAGGSLFVLMLLAMVISLLFGLGMPAPAAYILTASLAATAMVRFGVQDVSAHMFVFYFAMYASLTPPVGPSTIIAAKLAEASYLETAKQSMRVAAPGFLIPYVFVANDSLIYWEMPLTIVMTAIVTVCVTGLVIGIFGFDGRNRLSMGARPVFIGLALLGMFGPFTGVLGGYVHQVIVAAVLLALICVSFYGIIPISGIGPTQAADR